MKTKIAVTIGPSSCSVETVKAMALAGASAFRINFSHGSRDEWLKFVKVVREVEDEVGLHLALIGDLRGPSVRIGDLDEPVRLRAGDEAYLVLADRLPGGSDKRIPISNKSILRKFREGHILLMDDGRVVLRVLEGGRDKIALKALTDAIITSRKNIVIQGKDLELPTITEREIEAVRFAVQENFDYIGLSYVRGAEDISMLKGMLLSLGAKDVGIIAKIETPTAVKRLEEIVDSADVILVARGDLGMYFSLEEIPRLQEQIVNLCIERGKPVIIATQILGSMIENPIPTRGEIIDVVSAIRQGVDVLMLTGETAIGKYPVEVVKWLSKIIETYEPDITPQKQRKLRDGDVRDRFAYGVVSLAESLDAIVGVYTRSGKTAMRIASFRPRCRIFSASNSKRTLRKLALIWGIEAIMVSSKDYEEGLNELQSRIEKLIGKGIMVLTYGLREEVLHTVRIIQSGEFGS